MAANAAAVSSRRVMLSSGDFPTGISAVLVAERPIDVEAKGESWLQRARHSRTSRVWFSTDCEPSDKVARKIEGEGMRKEEGEAAREDVRWIAVGMSNWRERVFMPLVEEYLF